MLERRYEMLIREYQEFALLSDQLKQRMLNIADMLKNEIEG